MADNKANKTVYRTVVYMQKEIDKIGLKLRMKKEEWEKKEGRKNLDVNIALAHRTWMNSEWTVW